MRTLIHLLAVFIIALGTIAADSPSSKIFQMRLVVGAASNDSEKIAIPKKWHARWHEGIDGNYFFVQKAILIDQAALQSANVSFDALGSPLIDIGFSDQGTKQFSEITRTNIQKKLAVFIDGQLITAPLILSQITNGQAQISGTFDSPEATNLVSKLRMAIQKK